MKRVNILRDPPEKCQLNHGEDTLEKSRDSPRPVVGDVLCAESQPTTDQGSEVPQAVIDSGDPGTMLRMSDLSDKQRARRLSHRVAETHEETGSFVLWETHSSGLDGGGGNHDDATDGDWGLTAKPVAEERHNGKRRDGTNRVHSADTAQKLLRGGAHCGLPGIEELRSVHEGSTHYQLLSFRHVPDRKLTHRIRWWRNTRKE